MRQEHFGPLAPILGIDAAMVGLGLVAVVLNLLLLRVLCRARLTVDRGLMALIGVFDVAVSVFMIHCVVRRWGGGLAGDDSMCLVSAVVFNSATVLTPMLVAQLSLVRYLAIARGVRIGIAWLGGSLATLLLVWTMFLWRGLTSELVLLPSGVYCTPLYWGPRLADRLFGTSILLLVIPSLFTIPVAYYRVMAHYRALIPLDRLEGYITRRQVDRNARYIALVMVAYFVAFVPELTHVSLTIAFGVKRTALSDGVVMVLLFSITITNALFALLLHEETRRPFFSLIGHAVLVLKGFRRPL